jgi:LPS export ABC transporter protein LptC
MLSVNSTGKFLLLLAASFLLVRCGDKTKDAPATRHPIVPDEVTDVVSYLSEGINTTGTLTAKTKGKLTAPFMLQFHRADSPYTEFPRSLHVDFYKDSLKANELPQVESQMDALYGKYLTNQDKVYLRDSVVVKNILKGDTVHCKELWWDKATERFYTDKPVRIYTKDKILFGTGMEADQNFRWYNIKKLTGTILTSENAMPK